MHYKNTNTKKYLVNRGTLYEFNMRHADERRAYKMFLLNQWRHRDTTAQRHGIKW
jgi:hypothetical protein